MEKKSASIYLQPDPHQLNASPVCFQIALGVSGWAEWRGPGAEMASLIHPRATELQLLRAPYPLTPMSQGKWPTENGPARNDFCNSVLPLKSTVEFWEGMLIIKARALSSGATAEVNSTSNPESLESSSKLPVIISLGRRLPLSHAWTPEWRKCEEMNRRYFKPLGLWLLATQHRKQTHLCWGVFLVRIREARQVMLTWPQAGDTRWKFGNYH